MELNFDIESYQNYVDSQSSTSEESCQFPIDPNWNPLSDSWTSSIDYQCWTENQTSNSFPTQDYGKLK